MRHSTLILHGFICLAIFSSALVAQKRAETGMTGNANLRQNFAFEQLTIEHGLPHNSVRSILQDSQGFLWIGTLDGLARYDGYRFKIYKHSLADSTTISNSQIWVIFEDRTQNLWIGTYNGLNRFDRDTETFTRYTQGAEGSLGLGAHEVWAINEDHAGNLWVGYWSGNYLPWGGLYKLDRHTGKFTPYRYDPYNPNSMSHNAIRCIVEDDNGILWVGTDAEGLNRFDPKTETFIRYRHNPNNPHSLGDNRVWDGLKDRNGNLWFATMGAGLSKYGPGSDGFIRYTPNPDNSKGPYDYFDRYEVYQDTQGMLWLSNGVLSRFDPVSESFAHFRFSPNQKDWDSDYHPYAFHEDDTGNLWVGTRGNGVFKIDLKPRRFTHYQHVPEDSSGLSQNDIRLIFEDTKGLIWIATRDQGLSRLDPQIDEFTNFKHDSRATRSLNNNIVYTLCEDRLGNIWVGTQKGLGRFDPQRKSFTNFEHDPAKPHSLAKGAIRTIFKDHANTLWIGMATAAGFSNFDGQTEVFHHYVPDPANKELYHDVKFFEDRKGNLWVGSASRHYLFDRSTGHCRAVKGGWSFKHSTGGQARRLLEDQNGTLWGYWRNLNKLDVENMAFIFYRMLEPDSIQNGFDAVYNQIEFAYLDRDGKIWCGTRHGLCKFDPLQERVTARYYERDGLPSNLIIRIVEDHAGKLWLLTGGGVSIFDENAPPGAQFINLGPDDGIINTPSAPEAFIRTRNGEIYWGGTNGVYRFYPEIKSTNPHPPQIRLTDFRKFNQPVALDSSIATTRALRLRHDENFFSLAFAAMDFTNPRQNQYAYKLEGFDRDWIQGGNKNEASYTNVPPGTYTFRAKGSNNDGVWNEEGTSVQIIISPPYWQTWWFRMALVFAAIAVLTALYNYRVSKLLEIERTRLHIARDLHDDVGSSLSSIALTAELLQKESATDSLANRQLARVHETAKKLSRNLKEIVWAIDPQRDKFDDLLLQLKDITEELLGQKGIAYTLDIPQDGLPQSLKMDFRRNLFLIYKEMLHNIVQHSAATKVEIMLTRASGMLELQVADNGKGFRAAAAANGSGIKSMRARAAELKGTLEIDSLPERGTKMILTMRL